VSGNGKPSGQEPGSSDVEVARLDAKVALLIPRGGLDGEELEHALHRCLEILLGEGVTGVVIDMNSYAVLDSSGLGALVASHGDVAGAGARLVLTGVGQTLRRTLSRAMLLQVLPVYETIERAFDALRK
jgi:anti-anti-sigma factor